MKRDAREWGWADGGGRVADFLKKIRGRRGGDLKEGGDLSRKLKE
jgi:hypothetical protein